MVDINEVGYELFYECYGVDDIGRTGCYRTRNKEEILCYARRKPTGYILELKVLRTIPCKEVEQLNFFGDL